jgi:LysM repeat protein
MNKKWFVGVVVIVLLVFLVAALPISAAPEDSGCSVVHVVRPGETMYSIGRLYGVSMWAIANANGIVNPNFIYVGQCLVIPVCPAPAPGGGVHIVRPGETLTRIAARYGVSVWAIASANGLANINHIYVGQRLTIPGYAPPPKPGPKPTAVPSGPGGYPGPWDGEYFDNVDLTGTPYTTRQDAAISFNWNSGPPAGGMPVNAFSIRWTGTFHFSEGTYRFYAKVDDGVRLYVDGVEIISAWHDGSLRTFKADRALSLGNHAVKVEYYDRVGTAAVYVWWEKIEGPTATPGPSPTPGAPAPSAGWYAEFFNNEDLAGDPVVTRIDPWIGFDWGTDGPTAGVWADGFSVRWTTTAYFEADHYRLCTMSDDGSRLWVDGTLVVDQWHANNGIAYCGEYYATTGNHEVVVEYYEHGGQALIYVWWEPY